MKKRKGKRHTPEQIIKKLREADAMLAAEKPIGQVCQVLEVSEQTFHRWRNQFGGMKAEEAKRLKELEQENQRLKKLVADLTLDMEILKAAGEKPFIVSVRFTLDELDARVGRLKKGSAQQGTEGDAQMPIPR